MLTARQKKLMWLWLGSNVIYWCLHFLISDLLPYGTFHFLFCIFGFIAGCLFSFFSTIYTLDIIDVKDIKLKLSKRLNDWLDK